MVAAADIVNIELFDTEKEERDTEIEVLDIVKEAVDIEKVVLDTAGN